MDKAPNNPAANKSIAYTLKNVVKAFIFGITDVILSPLNFLYAKYLRGLRINRFRDFPITKKIFFKVGVYPIYDHYCEPMFDPKHLRYSLRQERYLPGIDMNIEEQLEILKNFNYGEELVKFPMEKTRNLFEFSYFGGPFPQGDSEYLYSIIRFFKPGKIIEIGSGHSTLMVRNAIKQNKSENEAYNCQHICIEPYENKWLEQLGIEIIRKKVEENGMEVFKSLDKNDILFIDSSHIIRPQGDVLFEFLEILPVLKEGVLVHVHDIFTPRDYLDEWIEIAAFTNEQYILEAFLTLNPKFKVIGALNHLRHNYFDNISQKCPILKRLVDQGYQSEPGSFWIRRSES